MTDFDTEMLNEKEPPEPLTPRKEEMRAPPETMAAGNTALAAALEAAREKEPPAAVPEPEAEPTAKMVEEAHPAPEPAPEGLTREEEEAARAAEAERLEAKAAEAEAVSEARRQEAARRRALGRVLAALLRDPEAALLTTLMEAYRVAEPVETEEAAEALTVLYLRAETEARRRLRPVLSEAIRRARDTALARALQGRLGAIAMPPPAPSPPPPEPDA